MNQYYNNRRLIITIERGNEQTVHPCSTITQHSFSVLMAHYQRMPQTQEVNQLFLGVLIHYRNH